ncbi:hypothetical protein EDB92DRAFT_2104152 [Lactarius akahatsu]|uniref:Uncharacterized protein n=1 Tax=Lactarius akahatsu TaxID=416441 RepID=A0AAD4LG92_9AGAM|nr:hypothetical protein EDB92DRAFT_2104152 [Lactarius akahatsu]
MKFATTSSIVVLAFSFLQLAHLLPVPAVSTSTPLPSGVPNRTSHKGEEPHLFFRTLWYSLEAQCAALNDLKASPRDGLLEFYVSMPATDSTIVLNNDPNTPPENQYMLLVPCRVQANKKGIDDKQAKRRGKVQLGWLWWIVEMSRTKSRFKLPMLRSRHGCHGQERTQLTVSNKPSTLGGRRPVPRTGAEGRKVVLPRVMGDVVDASQAYSNKTIRFQARGVRRGRATAPREASWGPSKSYINSTSYHRIVSGHQYNYNIPSQLDAVIAQHVL